MGHVQVFPRGVGISLSEIPISWLLSPPPTHTLLMQPHYSKGLCFVGIYFGVAIRGFLDVCVCVWVGVWVCVWVCVCGWVGGCMWNPPN